MCSGLIKFVNLSCRGITPNKGKIYLFRFFTNLLVGWKRWRRLLETECFLPCDGALHCSVRTNRKEKRIVLTWETDISFDIPTFTIPNFWETVSQQTCRLLFLAKLSWTLLFWQTGATSQRQALYLIDNHPDTSSSMAGVECFSTSQALQCCSPIWQLCRLSSRRWTLR